MAEKDEVVINVGPVKKPTETAEDAAAAVKTQPETAPEAAPTPAKKAEALSATTPEKAKKEFVIHIGPVRKDEPQAAPKSEPDTTATAIPEPAPEPPETTSAKTISAAPAEKEPHIVPMAPKAAAAEPVREEASADSLSKSSDMQSEHDEKQNKISDKAELTQEADPFPANAPAEADTAPDEPNTASIEVEQLDPNAAFYAAMRKAMREISEATPWGGPLALDKPAPVEHAALPGAAPEEPAI